MTRSFKIYFGRSNAILIEMCGFGHGFLSTYDRFVIDQNDPRFERHFASFVNGIHHFELFQIGTLLKVKFGHQR